MHACWSVFILLVLSRIVCFFDSIFKMVFFPTLLFLYVQLWKATFAQILHFKNRFDILLILFQFDSTTLCKSGWINKRCLWRFSLIKHSAKKIIFVKNLFRTLFWSRCPSTLFSKVIGQRVHWRGLPNESNSWKEKSAILWEAFPWPSNPSYDL